MIIPLEKLGFRIIYSVNILNRPAKWVVGKAGDLVRYIVEGAETRQVTQG